ncbi:MAG: class I SAM-dependent methyltransferase [Clostridia bacterium]|nr:class I SAM-dependent methyltransferase [Clostridia bacterium]
MYTDFAAVYDALMRGVDYDGWADYYALLLKRCGVEGGSVCECACGTGSLTVRLQRRGYAMTGVDISQEMLSVAAAKARNSGVMIPFVKQDMCRLALHRRQHAILCTCDGVNYLTVPDRARQFFRAAFQALRPGGALIFDLSSPYKLENTLGNNTLGSQEEDIAYIWQNAWQPRTSTVDMRLSIFVRGGEGAYARLEEIQRQRAYSKEELTGFLTDAGFERLRFYGDRTLRAPTAKAARWHVTAIRPKEK